MLPQLDPVEPAPLGPQSEELELVDCEQRPTPEDAFKPPDELADILLSEETPASPGLMVGCAGSKLEPHAQYIDMASTSKKCANP
jgi:hypothetical protein